MEYTDRKTVIQKICIQQLNVLYVVSLFTKTTAYNAIVYNQSSDCNCSRSINTMRKEEWREQ